MENIQTIEHTRTNTHPLVTLFVFFAIIATVVYCGSYFSHQRSMARALEEAGSDAAAAVASR